MLLLLRSLCEVRCVLIEHEVFDPATTGNLN
jgi:hypothetical protein